MKEIANWKSTEFRQFLLYVAPVALKDNVAQSVYRAFLELSLLIRAVCSEGLPVEAINKVRFDNLVQF